MQINNSPAQITEMAKALFEEERAKTRLDGWFLIREAAMRHEKDYAHLPLILRTAELQKLVAETLPLDISANAIFAGTQRDSFARSYALINPSFEVESFSGYCDPTAVFDFIEPSGEFTVDRIKAVRTHDQSSDYVKALDDTYAKVQDYTGEVVFFVEQVTGHLIPDLRTILRHGINYVLAEIDKNLVQVMDDKRKANFAAMKISLEAVLILARRYAEIAREQQANADEKRSAELTLLIQTLETVPANGARTLYEAIQSFLLLWQMMCMEQAPNPFAFSVGNADRIFEPFRGELDRETSAALFKHFLVFFNVGDRSWAISQNILISGRDVDGTDQTNPTTYALLDAYHDMNLPQPILSVKLHKNTPNELYESVGRFFFTPGCLTPSLFNDDALFEVLEKAGIEREDLPDYAVAGCQEPLIMGKDNGNTTNSWFNLGKILELTLNNGKSMITGKLIGAQAQVTDAKELLTNLRELFYQNVEFYAAKMAAAANDASRAVSLLPVPLLSTFMGGVDSGIDVRDATEQGTKYNASGCLIHGLAVVADSFAAVDALLEQRPEDCDRLLEALRTNFAADEELRQYLASCPKFGNNIPSVDNEAAAVARRVSSTVKAQSNYLGNPFRADWSTPSTHLLYGYWVGATPDGRKAREMLSYGVDPTHGDAHSGLGFRVLSGMGLPYELMDGGYASHFGIDPKYFPASAFEEKGVQFKERVIAPLFFNPASKGKIAPFYLYVNISTPETLRKVLANPKKYAPSGVYIMRIHGTFVNFLNLSPAIQQDIIARLDPASTAVRA